jgi:hypothetical protein
VEVSDRILLPPYYLRLVRLLSFPTREPFTLTDPIRQSISSLLLQLRPLSLLLL